MLPLRDTGPALFILLVEPRQRQQLPCGEKRSRFNRQMLAQHLADKEKGALRILPYSQSKEVLRQQAKAGLADLQFQFECGFERKNRFAHR